MPVFELPLEQLYTYGGRNPKPPDFDAYWDRALSDLSVTPPEPELVPHPNPATFANCFDLWFTGVGGARIHCQYVQPKSGGPHPAVLLFHGYAGRSGDWFDKLPWAAQGFAVAAMDVRGQGGLSEDTSRVAGPTIRGQIIRGLSDHPDKLLFRQIFLDTVQLATVVESLPGIDRNRVSVTGGSQGGGLALACAALKPTIFRVAAVFPYLCDYKRVWEMDLTRDAYDEIAYYFRYFDPTHEREDEIFTKLGYIDVQHLASRIRGEVLMITALMDTVCPPSTQFAAYNRILAPKQIVLYPDFGHDDLPGRHDRIFDFISNSSATASATSDHNDSVRR